MMNRNVKIAALVCLALLPVLFGIGWVADQWSKVLVIAASGATDALTASAITNLSFWRHAPTLLLVWAISSLITVGLAAMGIGPSLPNTTPPYHHDD